MTIAKFNVGDRCRCLHHYAFRGKEPFTIVSIATVPHPEYETLIRYVYVVKYDDGTVDAIPLNKEGGYRMQLLKPKVKKEVSA